MHPSGESLHRTVPSKPLHPDGSSAAPSTPSGITAPDGTDNSPDEHPPVEHWHEGPVVAFQHFGDGFIDALVPVITGVTG